MIEILPTRPLLGDDELVIYKLLAHLPITYCVDVGAASGGTCKLIKTYAPGARIDAFEPFPGNIKLFEDTVSGLDKVALHQAAVSATPGTQKLIMAATVQGTEPGWESRVGYSSGSRLAIHENSKNTIDVECVRIDDVCPEHISFLKIDVQGTETDVLESARRHFATNDVDLCFVEMDGDETIIEFFAEFNFRLFAIPTLLPLPEPIHDARFETVRLKNMSNGMNAQYVWDSEAPTDAFAFAAHIKALRSELKASVQTDLICVAPHFLDIFMQGADEFRKKMNSAK